MRTGAEPLAWNRAAEKSGERRRVFSGSMCDVMEDRPELAIHRVRLFNLIADTPHLDWLLLTKRPQNFRKFLPWGDSVNHWHNVWGMATVETVEQFWRIADLQRVSFAVRGLSVDPLLAHLREIPLAGIGWLILGGEIGHRARPMHPDWVLSVRDQCVAAAVAFFFKQWGEWGTFHSGPMSDLGSGPLVTGGGQRLADVGGYTMAKFGKEKSGAMIDGREWRESPVVNQ